MSSDQLIIKVIHPQKSEIFVRTRRELEKQDRLVHPNLLPIRAIECEAGSLLLVRLFVKGGTLRERLSKGPIALADGLRIMGDLIDGLAYLHKQNIVHGNLHPDNIFFTDDGKAMLGDVGLACLHLGSDHTNPEGTDQHRFSYYLAPEIKADRAGLRSLGHSGSDVYSLGCILFEMFSGRLYHYHPGKELNDMNLDAPLWLEHLLKKMLALTPKQRLETGECVTRFISVQTQPRVSSSVPLREKQQKSGEQDALSRQIGSPAVLPLRISLALEKSQSFQFALIPAGPFLMGSDPGKDPDAFAEELPQHSIHLNSFYMGVTPVTVAQFAFFVRASGYSFGLPPAMMEQPECPITQASQRDALAFCTWISKRLERKIYLPNEAEWEKAARGPSGHIYPWGNQLPDRERCNYNLYFKGLTPVGAFSPESDSPYGCIDIAGNVWEWTNSIWGKNWHQPDFPYKVNRRLLNDPGEIPDDVICVIRGGSYESDTRLVRCAHRGRELPIIQRAGLGFRVALIPFP